MMKLRAHHLLCFSREYGRIGGWYNNKELFEYVIETINKINKNPDIEIVRECDDVCEKCPYIKNNICNKPSKYKISHWVRVMDNKTLRLIKIKPNSVHKAKDIFKLIRNKVDDERLKNICKGCEYLNNCIRYSFNKSLVKSIL